jgi:hypothetical protein
LVDLLLRLDDRLCHTGVDDSNGTVGGFMQEVAAVLEQYAAAEPRVVKTFARLAGQKTCFEWEEPLVRLWDEAR